MMQKHIFNKIKVEYIFLFLILFIATYLRIWNITQFPLVDQDETATGSFAIDIMRFGIIKYIISPFLAIPQNGPMFEYTLIPSLYLFGLNIFALRLPSVIIGILTVFLIYLFVKEFYNKETALLTSFILAIYPTHIFLSRAAFEHVLLVFFVILCLYLFCLYKKTKKDRYLYLWAFSAGLGVNTKLNFIFFLIAFIPSFFIIFKNSTTKKSKINKKLFFSKKTVKKYVFVFLLFLLAIYPLIFFYTNDNFLILKKTLNSFPVTSENIDLRDVKTNFVSSLGLFYDFLRGSMNTFGFWIIGPLVFPISALISILSIIFLLFIDVAYFRNKSPSVFKKDLFLFINFFFIMILASTITTSEFHPLSYILLLPFLAIIIGRLAYEIFKKINFNLILFFLISLFVVVILIDMGNAHSFLDSSNVTYLCSSDNYEKVVKIMEGYNASNIFIDTDTLWRDLEWYMYRENLSNSALPPEEQWPTILNQKNSLYVFDYVFCGNPYNKINNEQKFLSFISRLNKTITENVIYEGEGLNYTFYYIK